MRIPSLTHNWTLKLAAVGLAVLLWTVTKAESLRTYELTDVPVQVAVRTADWELAEPPAPTSVTIVLSGPVRELLAVASDRPRIVIPVDEVSGAAEVRQLRSTWLQTGAQLQRTQIVDIGPPTVRLRFERVRTRLVPVAVRVRGELPAGLALGARPEADPPAITVRGGESRVARIDSVRTLALPLEGVRESARVTVPIDTAGLDGLLLAPRQVDVRLAVRAIAADSVLSLPGRGSPFPPRADTASTGRLR